MANGEVENHQEMETLQPSPDDAGRGYLWVRRIRKPAIGQLVRVGLQS